MSRFKWHPAAELLPMMEGDDYKRLKEDVERNGILKPVELYTGTRFPEYDGWAIDGRNRDRVCDDLGIDPPVKYLTDDDVGESLTGYVISVNVARRHLSSSQAAGLAVQLLDMLSAEAAERKRAGLEEGRKLAHESPENKGVSVRQKIDALSDEDADRNAGRAAEQAAKLAGTNRQYVADADKVRDASPKLFALITAGKLTVPNAVAALKLKADDPEAFDRLEAGEIDFKHFKELCDIRREAPDLYNKVRRGKTTREQAIKELRERQAGGSEAADAPTVDEPADDTPDVLKVDPTEAAPAAEATTDDTPEVLRDESEAAAAPEPSGPTDEKGRPITRADLLPAFALRKKLRGIRAKLSAMLNAVKGGKPADGDLLNSLINLANELKALKEANHAGLAWIDPADVAKKVSNIIRQAVIDVGDIQGTLRFGSSFIHCPDCLGEHPARGTCGLCRGNGHLPERSWNRLTMEQQQKAAEFVKGDAWEGDDDTAADGHGDSWEGPDELKAAA